METKNPTNINQTLDKMKISQQKMSFFIVIGIIIIFILGVIVIASAVKIRRSQEQSPVHHVPTPTIQPRSEMWIEQGPVSLVTGTEFSVSVYVNAYENIINGADAIVNFDPRYLKVTAVTTSPEALGQFQVYDRQSDDQVQLTLTKPSQSEAPTSKLAIAQVSFQGIRPGSTIISFEYERASTKGSTVISARNNENILDLVRGIEVTIQ